MSKPTPTPSATSRRRRHWVLLALPLLWCVAAIPLVNEVDYVFGSIPFLLVWMAGGVLLGSGAIGTVFIIDRRNGDLERI